MTHPDRAIEAGARARVVAAAQQAIMKNGFHDGSPVSAFGFANSAYGAILTALAAEGLVVVPAELTEAMRWATWIDQSKHIGANDQEARILAGRRMIDNPEQKAMDESAYRAMITAAQQEQNAPAPPKTGGE